MSRFGYDIKLNGVSLMRREPFFNTAKIAETSANFHIEALLYGKITAEQKAELDVELLAA